MRDRTTFLGWILAYGIATCSGAAAEPVPVVTVAVRGQAAPAFPGEAFQDFATSEDFALNTAAGPCISADGSIAFAATTQLVREGVWASYGGQLTRLVTQGAMSFGDSVVQVESLRESALSPMPLWKGYLLTQIRPNHIGDQVALAKFGMDSPSVLVSCLGYPDPAIPSRLSAEGISGIGADDHGNMFVNIVTGFSYATGTWHGVRRIGSEGVQVLLSTGDPAPGLPPESQTFLSGALLIGGSGKAVIAGRTTGALNALRAMWLIDHDTPRLLVRANAIMPGWIPNSGFVNNANYGVSGTASINARGLVAFAGAVNVPDGRRQGIWFGSDILVMPAAAEHEPVPAAGPGVTLGPPSAPRINDWTEMTFVALATGTSGSPACIWTGGVGAWFPAACAGASAQVAGHDVTLESIDTTEGLRINNLGQIAFTAFAIDSEGARSQGVCVYDPIAGLRMVVAGGDVLRTETGVTGPVTAVAFTADKTGDARQTGLNNSGTLVFAATTEGSAGVFTVDLNRLLCRADLNRDGLLDISDIFGFLDLYFTGSPRGDFDGSGTLSASDFYRYIDLFISGC